MSECISTFTKSTWYMRKKRNIIEHMKKFPVKEEKTNKNCSTQFDWSSWWFTFGPNLISMMVDFCIQFDLYDGLLLDPIWYLWWFTFGLLVHWMGSLPGQDSSPPGIMVDFFCCVFPHQSSDWLICYLEGDHHRGAAGEPHHQQGHQRPHQHCPQELLPPSKQASWKNNLISHKLFSFTQFWDLGRTCWRQGVSG